MKKGIMLNLADEKRLQLIGTFRGGATEKNILYESINNLVLSSKRKWFSVAINDVGDILQHRFYFSQEQKAKRLMDGLTYLKDHRFNEDTGYQRSIKYGEKVKKMHLNNNEYLNSNN